MTAVASERRRRSSQGGRQRLSPLASPRFGRRLFLAMAIVAAVYGGAALYRIIHAARTFGATYMGMPRAEVQYTFGPPDTQGQSGALWRMHSGDAETSFLFDARDQVAAVGCRAASGSGGDCPDILGLRLGDSEYDVWEKLGFPTSEAYANDSKVMAYPALGIRVKLRRTTIVAIEHRHVSGVMPFALRAISLLAP